MAPRKTQPSRTPTKRSAGRIITAKPPLEPTDSTPETIHLPNRHAAELTIKTLEDERRLSVVDSARVAALRALADAVDDDRSNASLWREYRAAEALLREVNDDDTDATQALIGSLSAAVGDETDAKPANARRQGGRRR